MNMETKDAKRVTVYFDADLHRALKMKSAITDRSISGLVNDAIRILLEEDFEDIQSVENRVNEPSVDYESFLKELKANGGV